ncbi:Major Facilitator Superfamily [Teratosphaeria destructans]|uniref:Major Facilitator Superfamily n=1 Tax=Teratosphaeria destructans TaxID=418781 RepID=A0A9W7SX12_9PEZI|nr:Major Facilitator Superfamily [Teratosphaeria destructans]
MFAFTHKRARSLISVYSIIDEKHERGEDEHVVEPQTPRQKRNTTLIYLLFVAEAMMQASLSSQVAVLVPQASGKCMGLDASFLRSIFESAYCLGAACGLGWGHVTDRVGRRRVALAGLAGMGLGCIAMGFASSFGAFAALRCVAGAMSSAVTVSGLAMLADSTKGASRTTTVAKLPLISACGSIAPIAANGLLQLSEKYALPVFARFPGLSGQLLCAGLVISIAIAEMFLLDETLPSARHPQCHGEQHDDSEKAAFLIHSHLDNPYDTNTIDITDALDDPSAPPRPSHITIGHMLAAPAILLLLASYAILSLHASTFDILLTHLGHTESQHGGMGLRCDWLSLVVAALQAFAALRLLHVMPSVVEAVGLLSAYRKASLAFPVLYLAIPMIGIGITTVQAQSAITEFISMVAISIKALYAGAAQILVLLLVLAAAPDASSTGIVIGVVSIAELFKALAVGIVGIAYYVSDDYTVGVVNFASWAALAVIAAVGAGLSWTLRDSPRIGTDIPEGCLTWQSIFDLENGEDETI